jgi:hypothetical protein
MPIPFQQIINNEIDVLQLSAKDEDVVTKFNELVAALKVNRSIKTIIAYHLDPAKSVVLMDLCEGKKTHFLNLQAHQVAFDGVRKAITGYSPTLTPNMVTTLNECATEAGSFTINNVDPELLIGSALLPNNKLVLVQYAARPVSQMSLDQFFDTKKCGPNVLVMIIDLENKVIVAKNHFAKYQGIEVCGDSSNRLAILTEEKIFIMNTTPHFVLENSINFAATTIKFLPDGMIKAIPAKPIRKSGDKTPSKRLPTFVLINPLTHQMTSSENMKFQMLHPETNQPADDNYQQKMDNITILAKNKIMTSNANFMAMLTLKEEEKTNTIEFIMFPGNRHSIAIDQHTVATGSSTSIQIFNTKNHVNCTAGNLFISNTQFRKLLYFPEQKLLASIFDTFVYFWKIAGKSLKLKGVLPIPKNSQIINANNQLMIATINQRGINIQTFNITLPKLAHDIKTDDYKPLSLPRGTFYNNGLHLQPQPAPTQPTSQFSVTTQRP